MRSGQKLVQFNNVVVAILVFSLFLVRFGMNATLPSALQDTITLALGILFEALPFIFLGILLSVSIQQFVSKKVMLRFVPKKGIFRRPFLACIGIFLPVCECGNIPLARGLIAKGLKPSEVLTFLFAAPIINPITIYTTMQAFQGNNKVVVIRVLAAFIIAVAVGLLFSKLKSKDVITDDFQQYCDDHDHLMNNYSGNFLTQKIKIFADNFSTESAKLLPALVFGSFLAGIIQTVIPRSILTTVSQQPILAILALLVLAFVVSICANVDAFFALSLSSIFPISAIIAFLVFGPMIDIKILTLLKTTFRPRILIQSSIFIFLASLLTGLLVAYAL